MSMRLSGLISGMDTEYVVEQMMKAHRLKTTKVQNKITTTEWKQDKWSALNSKIYSFYTGALSKMRMQGSYAIKKASSSNTSKVEVSAGTNAPEGTHLIKVKKLASSQFLTGAKLELDDNDKEINLGTKLVDLGFKADEGTTIHINAKKNVDLEIRENTTVNDLINSLRDAGLNANYDTVHKRFFISSKSSGVENSFAISSSSTEFVRDKNAVKDFLGYDDLSSSDKTKVDGLLNEYLNDNLVEDDRIHIKNQLLEIKHMQVKDTFIKEFISNEENIADATSAVKERLSPEELESIEDDVLQNMINDELMQKAEEAAFTEHEAWKNGEIGEEGSNVFEIAEKAFEPYLEDYINDSNEDITQSGSLTRLGLAEMRINDKQAEFIVEEPKDGESKDEVPVLVKASDSEVEYNGAVLTGSSNVFTANGLTFTLKGVTSGLDTPTTDDDEVISVSVSGNTEAVYDMIKDFVKTYNDILKEMNEAYNAESARGYDPLTEEERETMTEEQIKKWEDRIKDSLLRRDDTLGGLINALRSTLSEPITVNGKTYSLASFGISTRKYSEKGMLHISGDADFSEVAGLENQLMESLANNPEEVAEVLSKLGEKLYSNLMDRMKSTSLSSALTLYNDKEMTESLTRYKKDLAKLEAKLVDIENKYFKQFAAMESAMARINSQSSALMSMLGMGGNQNV